MSIVYEKAGLDQLDLLVSTRIEVLRAANRLNDDVDMSGVERQSREYYAKALADGTHTAYLAFSRIRPRRPELGSWQKGGEAK